jgi:hypothetical protein
VGEHATDILGKSILETRNWCSVPVGELRIPSFEFRFSSFYYEQSGT